MLNKGMKAFALFAVLLMVVSIMPMGALAAQDNGKADAREAMKLAKAEIKNQTRDQISTQNMDNVPEDAPTVQAANRGMVNSAIKTATKFQAAGQDFKNSKEAYEDARDNFQKVKVKGNGNLADSEEFVNATKEYLNTTINYMEDHLTGVQSNFLEGDAQYENIQDYIDRLEDAREDLEDAETRKELADVAKDIRDVWKDAQKDARNANARSVNNKVKGFLDKSDSVSDRIEDEIERLKEQGVDTSELEDMLEEYNELIAEAERNHELAQEAYQEGDSAQAQEYLRATIQNMEEAGKVLKNMLNELEEHRQGVVSLSGTGTLVADGNGTAVLSGNFTILNITAQNATLVVKDLAGNANILVNSSATYDFTNSENKTSPTFSEKNNRALVFHGFNGDVEINGSRLTVMIRGEDVHIEAEGSGKAILTGNGKYSVDGVSSGELSWAEPVDDEDTEDEEEGESEEGEEEFEDTEDEVEDENESEESVNDEESESEESAGDSGEEETGSDAEDESSEGESDSGAGDEGSQDSGSDEEENTDSGSETEEESTA